jgi:hypothetical protein
MFLLQEKPIYNPICSYCKEITLVQCDWLVFCPDCHSLPIICLKCFIEKNMPVFHSEEHEVIFARKLTEDISSFLEEFLIYEGFLNNGVLNYTNTLR